MPKIVIEFDLPEGQDIPSAEDIVRLTSPDWHSEWWHFEDVQSVAEDLTDDEAREVLGLMAKYSDCNVGINWETIEVWADIVRDERPPSVCECCHEEFDKEDLEKVNGKLICGECEIDLRLATEEKKDA